MNRNAISRLVEVSLLAGIAVSFVGAGPGFAQDEVLAAKPVARQKIATQKLMRNPWQTPARVAAIQPGTSQKRLYVYR